MPRIRRLPGDVEGIGVAAAPIFEDSGWIPSGRAARAATAAAAVLTTHAAQAAIAHDAPELPTAVAPTEAEGWSAPRPKPAATTVRLRLYDGAELHVPVADDGAWLPRKTAGPPTARRIRPAEDERAPTVAEDTGWQGRAGGAGKPSRLRLDGVEVVPPAVVAVTIEDGGWTPRRPWAVPVRLQRFHGSADEVVGVVAGPTPSPGPSIDVPTQTAGYARYTPGMRFRARHLLSPFKKRRNE